MQKKWFLLLTQNEFTVKCTPSKRRGNSSAGRAQPCQGWGREFESRFPLEHLIYLWLDGRVVMQRPAKPWTPVRLRLQPSLARVAEQVDARDLKSLERWLSCRFDSGPGQFSLIWSNYLVYLSPKDSCFLGTTTPLQSWYNACPSLASASACVFWSLWALYSMDFALRSHNH